MKTEDRISEVKFRFSEGEHTIEGIVLNPGSYFGKVWILQIAIANALNPFYAIEANSEQDAIDEFADGRLSKLIDVPEENCPKFVPNDPENYEDGDMDGEYENENDYTQAGNDGHWVDLSNCHIKKAPSDIKYFVEWSPEQDELSCVIDTELETVREENDDC